MKLKHRKYKFIKLMKYKRKHFTLLISTFKLKCKKITLESAPETKQPSYGQALLLLTTYIKHELQYKWVNCNCKGSFRIELIWKSHHNYRKLQLLNAYFHDPKKLVDSVLFSSSIENCSFGIQKNINQGLIFHRKFVINIS